MVATGQSSYFVHISVGAKIYIPHDVLPRCRSRSKNSQQRCFARSFTAQNGQTYHQAVLFSVK